MSDRNGSAGQTGCRVEGDDGAPNFWGFRESWWWGGQKVLIGLGTRANLPGMPGIIELKVERVEGIEPSTKAWEAFVLPLNYTRITYISLLTKRGVL